MNSYPRVALFADCFQEINGVALTSRNFVSFAARQGIPFQVIHAAAAYSESADASISFLGLPRSPFRMQVDRDLSFDFLFLRHLPIVCERLKKYRPDCIHITSPGDVGILGSMVAYRMKIPLVASWHTNVHSFAGRRWEKLVERFPSRWREQQKKGVEHLILRLALLYYKQAKFVFVPNRELAGMIEEGTGKQTILMKRGVDADLFSPRHRTRTGQTFHIGFVGRLEPEKSVHLLIELERGLLQAGIKDFRFSIVGNGSELLRLHRQMKKADFYGVLQGSQLACAYANMDLFVFPSETDTFGNAVLEAQSSGVPVIVSSQGGPKYLIRQGETGLIAREKKEYLEHLLLLIKDRERSRCMGMAARKHAATFSWDCVFKKVYEAYDLGLCRTGMKMDAQMLATTE